MGIGRVLLEKELTNEQIIALYLHYRKEEEDRKEHLKGNNPELFDIIKSVVNSMRPDILKSHKEHLRKGA